MTAALPPLHLLTDDAVCARPGFAALAERLLDVGGGRMALHLRVPGGSGRRLHDLGAALLPAARAGGAWLVINDRVDVALALGADGVQLGERGLSPADARAIAPRLAVGVSVHEAGPAPSDASWLVAGTLFATPSHPGRPGAGTGLISALAGKGVPVIGVGGITPARAAEVRAAGGAGVAVIRGVWDAPDPAAAVRDYLDAWDR